MYGEPTGFRYILQHGFKIATWFAIEIRIHLLFVIWVSFDMLQAQMDGYFVDSLIRTVFLFTIVLLHEFGHCFAGRWVGGSADKILLWPLGGLAFVAVDTHPTKQLIVAVGGPAVNVALMIILAPYFIWGPGELGSTFLRLYPDDAAAFYGNPLNIFFSVNLDLFIFNLIPAFPMDGGRILRSLLWYRIGLERATIVSIYIAYVFLGLMLLAGLGLFFTTDGSLLLAFLAVFLLFGAAQEMKMVKSGAYRDEGGGGTYGDGLDFSSSFKPERTSWLEGRRQRKKQKKAEKEFQERVDIKQRVDELLEKISVEGESSLTSRERRFMTRASKLYRDL